jgi:isopentenyldiphosphate isomerase
MIEMLDVYDANGQYLGIADRDVVHSCGLWHTTIHCWIGIKNLSGENFLVFQRRVSPNSTSDGKLYTTASGHVMAGETLGQAFDREISQEIGINLKNATDCQGEKFITETIWVKDMTKKDGTIMHDRVFANIFCAVFENTTKNLTNDLDFWHQFVFNDGEVSGLIAINTDDFIDMCNGQRDTVSGIEWNMKDLQSINLAPDYFVLMQGETLYKKYKHIAEYMNLPGTVIN